MGLALSKSKKARSLPTCQQFSATPRYKKILDHAMFDLRLLCYHWRLSAQNIAGTNIVGTLLDPEKTQGHTWAGGPTMASDLGVTLDKGSPAI